MVTFGSVVARTPGVITSVGVGRAVGAGVGCVVGAAVGGSVATTVAKAPLAVGRRMATVSDGVGRAVALGVAGRGVRGDAVGSGSSLSTGSTTAG